MGTYVLIIHGNEATTGNWATVKLWSILKKTVLTKASEFQHTFIILVSVTTHDYWKM